MNLQCKLRWLRAVVFASAALFLFPNSARAQTQPATQSIEGLWLTDGYGMFIEFQGDNLRGYEITRLSCIASAKATRKTVAGAVDEIVFAEDDDIFKNFPKLTGLVIDVRINSCGSDCLDDEPVGRAGGTNVARVQMLIKQLTGRLAINRMQPTQLISLSAPQLVRSR